MSSGVDRRERVLSIIETARAKRPRFRDQRVTLAHGAGGKASSALIEGLLVPALGAPEGTLQALSDAGLVQIDGAGLAISTDSFVVKPIRFPGGSIGELAVNGTVNDLAVSGARPIALSISMILEEGLSAEVLRSEVQAIATAARAAEVEIVAGDTKVVERGACDQMYLSSTGVGALDSRARLTAQAIRPGDRILVSGPIGEHGMAIMLARGEFDLDAQIESDTCSLWPAMDALLDACGPDLHCARDATRGGIASVLNELARAAGVSVTVDEARVPVPPTVAAAAELLGIDPMYIANEGTLIAFIASHAVERALKTLRGTDGHEQAAIIGHAGSEPPGMVLINTAFGGRRVMDQLVGDPLPRIC